MTFYEKILYLIIALFKGVVGYKQAAEMYSKRGKATYDKNKYKLGDPRYNKTLDKAISEYAIAIDFKPTYVEAYYQRGLLKMKLGNYQGAIDDFTEILKINHENANAYYYRGNAWQELIDSDSRNQEIDYCKKAAIDNYNKVLILDPKYYKAYIKMGKVTGKRMEYFTKAIEINPNYAEAYYLRGCLKKTDDKRGAIDDFNMTIEINPNNLDAYFERAEVKLKLLDYIGAIDDYSAVIETAQSKDQKVPAYILRAKTKRVLKNLKGAISDYNRAIEIWPKFNTFYFDRGLLKNQIEDYKGAISDFNYAIYNAPHGGVDGQYYLYRGKAKKALQDFKGSINDFNRAIEIDESYGLNYRERAKAKFGLTDYEGAIEDLTKAIKIYENDSYYADKKKAEDTFRERAWVKLQLKDNEGAKIDFTRSNGSEKSVVPEKNWFYQEADMMFYQKEIKFP